MESDEWYDENESYLDEDEDEQNNISEPSFKGLFDNNNFTIEEFLNKLQSIDSIAFEKLMNKLYGGAVCDTTENK